MKSITLKSGQIVEVEEISGPEDDIQFVLIDEEGDVIEDDVAYDEVSRDHAAALYEAWFSQQISDADYGD